MGKNMTRMLLALGLMAIGAVAARGEVFFQPEGMLPMPVPGAVPMPVPGAERRTEIRSMDILERPYRVGHFYGNTVRRRFYRQMPMGSEW